MKKLKEYLQKKKADSKFKQFGAGHVLAGGSTSGPPPQNPRATVERRALTAQAVDRRLNPNSDGRGSELTYGQKKLRLQVKRELDEEQKRLADNMHHNLHLDAGEEESLDEEEMLSKSGETSLLYTCDLLEGVILPKAEILEQIEAYLVAQLSIEPIDASVLMIHSLNSRQARAAAISTLETILTNVLREPEEKKFRRIRTTTKVFMEKLAKVKGTKEFLKALGFREENSAHEGSGQLEPFLILDEALCPIISDALQELSNGSAVTLKLHRDPKVFRIDPAMRHVPEPRIPADFFDVTVSDLKQQQTRMSNEVEKLTTLRTREMREADSNNRRQPYKYTLIRVRFPNAFILQGVFNARENVMAVREFIAQHLHPSTCGGTFSLLPSLGGRLDSEEKTLAEYGLVPTTLLNFEWDNGASAHFLRTELEKNAGDLPKN